MLSRITRWRIVTVAGTNDSREALGGADGDGDAACPVEGLMLLGGRDAALGVEVGE
jgi:hypothetical protein